jgi:hypothetical protein
MSITFETLLQGDYGFAQNEGKPFNVLIRKQREWDAFYQALERHNKEDDVASLHSPNFSTSTVLAVCAGRRPSEGYRIDITDILELEGKGVAEAYITLPEQNNLRGTYPLHVVVISHLLQDIAVTFFERRESEVEPFEERAN